MSVEIMGSVPGIRFKSGKEKIFNIQNNSTNHSQRAPIFSEKLDQSPPPAKSNITVNGITAERAINSAQEGLKKLKEDTSKKPRIIGGKQPSTRRDSQSGFQISTDIPKKRVLTSDNVKKQGIIPPKFAGDNINPSNEIISKSNNLDVNNTKSRRENIEEIINRINQDPDVKAKQEEWRKEDKEYLAKKNLEKMANENPNKFAEKIQENYLTENKVTDLPVSQQLKNLQLKQEELKQQQEKLLKLVEEEKSTITDIKEIEKTLTLVSNEVARKSLLTNIEQLKENLSKIRSGKDDQIESEIKNTNKERELDIEETEILDQTELGIQLIENSRNKNIGKLQNCLVKLGFDPKQISDYIYYTQTEGKTSQEAWKTVKHETAQKRYTKSKETIIENLEIIKGNIKTFDNIEEKFVKQNIGAIEKGWLKQIDKMLSQDEYKNINDQEIKKVRENISIIKKNLKEVRENYKQWKKRNNWFTQIKDNFARLNAQFGNDKEKIEGVELSINQREEDLKKQFEKSHTELIESINNLNKSLTKGFDAITVDTARLNIEDNHTQAETPPEEVQQVEEFKPELENEVNIDPLAILRKKSEKVEKADIDNNDSGKNNEAMSGKTNEIVSDETTENNIASQISNLYSEIVKKLKAKQELSEEDRNNINKIKKFLKDNHDIKKLSVEDQSGKNYDVDVEQIKTYLNSLEKKQPEKTKKPSRGLFTRRSPTGPKNTVTSEPTVPSAVETKELSKEERDKLNNIFTKYAPGETDRIKNNERLEKLMEIINDKSTPNANKDIATLQFINYPQVGLNNLDFGDKINKKDLLLQKKALQDKVNEIFKKYASEDDELSKNIKSLVKEIEDKYQFDSSPRAEVVAPKNELVPASV